MLHSSIQDLDFVRVSWRELQCQNGIFRDEIVTEKTLDRKKFYGSEITLNYLRKGTDGLDLINARIKVCAWAAKHQKVGQ